MDAAPSVHSTRPSSPPSDTVICSGTCAARSEICARRHSASKSRCISRTSSLLSSSSICFGSASNINYATFFFLSHCGTKPRSAARTRTSRKRNRLANRPGSRIEPNLRFASPENGNDAENAQRSSAQRAVELPNTGRGDSLPEATSPPTAGFPATLQGKSLEPGLTG